jgi:hypothetical protein
MSTSSQMIASRPSPRAHPAEVQTPGEWPLTRQPGPHRPAARPARARASDAPPPPWRRTRSRRRSRLSCRRSSSALTRDRVTTLLGAAASAARSVLSSCAASGFVRRAPKMPVATAYGTFLLEGLTGKAWIKSRDRGGKLDLAAVPGAIVTGRGLGAWERCAVEKMRAGPHWLRSSRLERFSPQPAGCLGELARRPISVTRTAERSCAQQKGTT